MKHYICIRSFQTHAQNFFIGERITEAVYNKIPPHDQINFKPE